MNQYLDQLTDLIVVSHPSEVYDNNVIELRSLNDGKLFKTLVIEASDYPYKNDKRSFGLNVKIRAINEEIDGKLQSIGFEVAVLDIPLQNSITLRTD